MSANNKIVSLPSPVALARSLPSPPQPSYQELRCFFDESIDLLCIASFEGRFTQLNLAWESALQWTLQELEARPFIDFVHPDDRPATLAEMEKLVGGDITITFENRYHCKDGSWKWLQWTAAPLPGRKEIYAIARDVTLQKDVEKEIHRALDRERERVGRDLHDGLGSHLAAIGYAANFLKNDLLRRKLPEAALAQQIAEMVSEAMSHTQHLARGLVPVQVGGPALALALQDFARTTSSLRGIRVSFRETGDPRIESVDDSTHIYRIAQEAVNNAAKHGDAKRIDITLRQTKCSLELIVTDDGTGFVHSVGGKSGLGLRSMQYRARVLGGKLKMQTNSPRGTIVSCEIPNYPDRGVTPLS